MSDANSRLDEEGSVPLRGSFSAVGSWMEGFAGLNILIITRVALDRAIYNIYCPLPGRMTVR